MNKEMKDKYVYVYSMFSMIFAFLAIASFVADMVTPIRGMTKYLPFWFLGLKKLFDILYEKHDNRLSPFTIIISVLVFIVAIASAVQFL